MNKTSVSLRCFQGAWLRLESEDLRQGGVGDCWFMSVCSSELVYLCRGYQVATYVYLYIHNICMYAYIVYVYRYVFIHLCMYKIQR